MKAVWHGLLAVFLACGMGAASASESDILSAKQAYDKARAGELTLVDIRSPKEWTKYGIPQASVTETIHRDGGMPAFVAALLARLGGNKSKPVAVICASGKRSAYTRQYLEQAGFTNISDVSEGMMGSDRGAGWHRHGLPIAVWKKK